MPVPALKSMASKAGVSLAKAEEYYARAKKIAKEQYPDVRVDSDRYYAVVMGITKKMMGVKEAIGIISTGGSASRQAIALLGKPS